VPWSRGFYFLSSAFSSSCAAVSSDEGASSAGGLPSVLSVALSADAASSGDAAAACGVASCAAALSSFFSGSPGRFGRCLLRWLITIRAVATMVTTASMMITDIGSTATTPMKPINKNNTSGSAAISATKQTASRMRTSVK
jgi:hypothetical protein